MLAGLDAIEQRLSWRLGIVQQAHAIERDGHVDHRPSPCDLILRRAIELEHHGGDALDVHHLDVERDLARAAALDLEHPLIREPTQVHAEQLAEAVLERLERDPEPGARGKGRLTQRHDRAPHRHRLRAGAEHDVGLGDAQPMALLERDDVELGAQPRHDRLEEKQRSGRPLGHRQRLAHPVDVELRHEGRRLGGLGPFLSVDG